MSELNDIEKSLLLLLKNLEKSISESCISCNSENLTLDKSVCGLNVVGRIKLIIERLADVQEILFKLITDLNRNVSVQKSALEKTRRERDVLQERIHAYLEMNSSLTRRLEEQRCAKPQTQANDNLIEKKKLDFHKHFEVVNWTNSVNRFVKETNCEILRKNDVVTEGQWLRGHQETRGTDSGSRKLKCERVSPEEKMSRKIRKCSSLISIVEPFYDPIQEFHNENRETTLKTLQRELSAVTKKLNVLKCDSFNSGDGGKEDNCRILFDKAEPLYENPSRTPTLNLSQVLDDAKKLNVKLQNLRNEKQKSAETKVESEKRYKTENEKSKKNNFEVLEEKKDMEECRSGRMPSR
ncbi:hypothetical protein RUM44_003281 [Polyplax serrata]|uniref:Uncharacterized protein n=1 Tax=Polyplax serrata TaxID=468196 RepID=A0ABR1AFZ9_POLSC